MPDVTQKTVTITLRNAWTIGIGLVMATSYVTSTIYQFKQVQIELKIMEQRSDKRYERDRAEFQSLWDAIDVLRVKGSDHEQTIQE